MLLLPFFNSSITHEPNPPHREAEWKLRLAFRDTDSDGYGSESDAE